MDKMSGNAKMKWSAVLFSFVFLFFMSCEGDKNEVIFQEDEKTAYESEESTEHVFDIIESITNSATQYYESNPGARMAGSSDPELACATVTFEGNQLGGRVEINFGDGCVGPDGKTRKGVIVVEYDGYWAEKDSEIYTVLKDFYVDGVKIEGTRILTNVSLDVESLVYTEEIVNGKVTWPDNTYLTRISNRTHTLVFGSGINDFELQVEGVATGKTRMGLTYSTEIIEPLVFKTSCRENMVYLPVSGIKTITIPEKPLISVNYGSGDCDTSFTISIESQSKEVTL